MTLHGVTVGCECTRPAAPRGAPPVPKFTFTDPSPTGGCAHVVPSSFEVACRDDMVFADDDDDFQSTAPPSTPLAAPATSSGVPAEQWLEEMTMWLSEERVSDGNLRSVMRVVRRLAMGEGVEHPASMKFFRRGQAVSIDADMEELVRLGKEFLPREDDKSKGWKLDHPLGKLKKFQKVFFERRRTAAAGAPPPLLQQADSDDEEAPLGLRRTAKAQAAPVGSKRPVASASAAWQSGGVVSADAVASDAADDSEDEKLSCRRKKSPQPAAATSGVAAANSEVDDSEDETLSKRRDAKKRKGTMVSSSGLTPEQQVGPRNLSLLRYLLPFRLNANAPTHSPPLRTSATRRHCSTSSSFSRSR